MWTVDPGHCKLAGIGVLGSGGAMDSSVGRRRFTMLIALTLVAIGLATTSPAWAGDGSTRATAIDVASLPFSVASTTTGDATSQVTPSCATSTGRGARWFQYASPRDLDAVIHTTEQSSGQLTVTVYRAFPTGLTELRCATLYGYAFSHLRIHLQASTTYFVVFSTAMSFGSLPVVGFGLDFTESAPPTNDHQAEALSISSLPASIPTDFFTATTDPGEQLPSCANEGENSVWYHIDLVGREGVQIKNSRGGAIAVRSAAGVELFCSRTSPTGDDGGNPARFRTPVGGRFFVQVTGTDYMTTSFIYRAPPTNDDVSNPVALKYPDALASHPLPVLQTQDGVMSSIEPGEPATPDLLGSLWWAYLPDHHTYVTVRPENQTYPDNNGLSLNVLPNSGGLGECCPWATIRVFEFYNNRLGREVDLDRSFSTNGSASWLASGGTPYAIQLGTTKLVPLTLYATLNPQGTSRLCNYNSCVL